MGYMHIENLYKNQRILEHEECYVLEKIHGTSAHILWKAAEKKLIFFSGGVGHEPFTQLFDKENLRSLFEMISKTNKLSVDIIIYGEAYGGKLHGMSKSYGKELRFVAFDVKVGEIWLDVPFAAEFCSDLGVEFVDWDRCPAEIESLNFYRDKPSTQSIRNGCGEEQIREGIVIRPIVEQVYTNGSRFIVKHKRNEFMETKTPREVDPEKFEIVKNAQTIASEWVTEMRLTHVLDKLPIQIDMKNTRLVIEAMIEDVYREAKGEIVENDNVRKQIGNRTAVLFKKYLQKEQNGIPE